MSSPAWTIELIAVGRILPNEEHEAPRLREVLDSIARSGHWTTPIVLERSSLAVMDGHHRLAAAQHLALSRVPCLLLDYTQVRVETRRAGIEVDGEQVVARSLARVLYPPKTTRHVFPDGLPGCSIAISALAAMR
ncbi:MAG: ParB N-terminal domain-containing protein [Burkholderia sp.]